MPGDDAATMRTLAAALDEAVADAHGEPRREIVDVLAVAAGLKPAAVIGFGGGNPAEMEAVAEVAARFGLESRHCTAWLTRGELVGVPAWFADEIVAVRRRTPLIALSLLPDRLHALQGHQAGTLAPFTESALLGYPTCCTAHHAEWRGALHRALADGIRTAAGGNRRRAQRLLASGWAPTPAPGTRLPALATGATAPHTAIVMCPNCFAFPTSPARRISAAFAELAQRHGLDADHDGTERDLPPMPPARGRDSSGTARTATP